MCDIEVQHEVVVLQAQESESREGGGIVLVLIDLTVDEPCDEEKALL